MTLYEFLSSEREGEGAPPRILSAALLSGATNAGVLVIVAAAKSSLGKTRPDSGWRLPRSVRFMCLAIAIA